MNFFSSIFFFYFQMRGLVSLLLPQMLPESTANLYPLPWAYISFMDRKPEDCSIVLYIWEGVSVGGSQVYHRVDIKTVE